MLKAYENPEQRGYGWSKIPKKKQSASFIDFPYAASTHENILDFFHRIEVFNKTTER